MEESNQLFHHLFCIGYSPTAEQLIITVFTVSDTVSSLYFPGKFCHVRW